MNEVHWIQKVLEEYLENRKAAKVAVKLFAVMHGETQHTHGGEVFFIHKDEEGKLVLTMKSDIKSRAKEILKSHLKEDEVQECIEHIIERDFQTEAIERFETIMIPGSEFPIYAELMKHDPANQAEESYIYELSKVIRNSVKEFQVFVNDPSIYNNELQFAPGFRPAVDFSYNQLEKLAKENGFRLGTKDEYVIFLGWLINSLINEGWSETASWNAVCTDSKKLGHFFGSEDAKGYFDGTGSRKVAGKCDLGNTYKILAKDKEAGGFWLAGGSYFDYGRDNPLAHLELNNNYEDQNKFGVGWFVC